MLKKKYNIKNNIRTYMRIMRKSLTPERKYYESLKIALVSLNLSYIIDAQNIALFLPFDGEINTYPLISKLWLKKKVFLPVIHSFYNKQLLFVQFHSNSILYYNQYNILEPYFTSKDVISVCDLDVIIVPLVAFDRTGLRLGMGGGFYDNVLTNWKQQSFIPIGFAYDFQLVNSIPKQYWDVSLPIILTSNKVWFF